LKNSRIEKQMAIAETALLADPSQTAPAEDVYDDGYLRIEHQNYYLTCDGQPIYLPRVEFLLISRLARSVERVVSSDDLWRAAWGEQKPLNCGSLHVYMHRLRNKLRPHNLQIEVMVNVGYRLIKPRENRQP
jgi:two-component system, OmpR family, alkaline phosphatase synthesis response regulator PhoP